MAPWARPQPTRLQANLRPARRTRMVPRRPANRRQANLRRAKLRQAHL
jgi:hypothetical protein